MKILTVCVSWRMFGAETVTLKMLEGFQARGHEQLALTSIWTDGEFSRRVRKLGIQEKALPFGAVVASLSPPNIKWTLAVIGRLPGLWWQWWKVQRAFQPDVIIWTGAKQALLLLPWVGRKPSCLIEFTSPSPTRNMRWLFGKISQKFSSVVAVSEFMRGKLVQAGAALNKIRVIKSGVFFAREQEAIRKSTTAVGRDKSSPPCIGIVGQIAANKGHDDLLAAMKLLKERGVNLEVRVFGSGHEEYVGLLREKIVRAGLTGTWKWMGFESNKAKMFGGMDVCVVPSCFGDPFPTVAMEAGAYGLPVVASREGGLPEIVEDGVTGWLVEANAPAALAEKIEWLIRNPDRAREMGAAGCERIFKHFTVEKMVAELEMLFSEFVGKTL